LHEAHSTEIKEYTPDPVIDLMAEQKAIRNMGGTMRLGAYPCTLVPGSRAAEAYGTLDIEERHRHRYEFNSDYLDRFEAAGLVATGRNPETGLVEVVELPAHPWFVAAQFHPEYSSTVLAPHPLFTGFVAAARLHATVQSDTSAASHSA
jgi:CTP synthase